MLWQMKKIVIDADDETDLKTGRETSKWGTVKIECKSDASVAGWKIETTGVKKPKEYALTNDTG
jgi:hypothetical protein